jgi:hypothetical protein
VKGIEPSYAAWEAAVLPLNYTRECGDFTWVATITQLQCVAVRGKMGVAVVILVASSWWIKSGEGASAMAMFASYKVMAVSWPMTGYTKILTSCLQKIKSHW